MMKSSDLGKVRTIMTDINSLNMEIGCLNRSKDSNLNGVFNIGGNAFWLDDVLSIKVINVIFEEYNSKRAALIDELKQLGVEYVDETA